jgi:SAM-dependent methyltransferase
MQNVEYVPCDLFPDVYGWYADGVKIRKADITDIPFEPDSFDVVLCNHVLEHIPDDRRAMSELYRVMKKGAWAILQVPIDYNREKTYEDFSITDPCGRTKAFGQHDHVRWYGRDYADRLRSVGFTVIEETYVKTLPQADVSRYGLDPSEILYFCRKE